MSDAAKVNPVNRRQSQQSLKPSEFGDCFGDENEEPYAVLRIYTLEVEAEAEAKRTEEFN